MTPQHNLIIAACKETTLLKMDTTRRIYDGRDGMLEVIAAWYAVAAALNVARKGT
jgi:hypothetical protein